MSLFYWHNESVNMWMHYIASTSLVFFGYWTLNLGNIDYSDPVLSADMTVLAVSVLLGNVVPIFLSAFCHHFYCVNQKLHNICWFLDFIGILTGELSGGISFIYLAFYCNRAIAYSLMYVIIVGYILALQWCWKRYNRRVSQPVLSPVDRIPEFSKYLSAFGFLASVLPLALTVTVHTEYWTDPQLFVIFACSCIGPFLMAMGIVLFAQGHIPERFCKQWGLPDDYFDFVGHSHQMWHAVSASLMYAWITVLAMHYKARINYGCGN